MPNKSRLLCLIPLALLLLSVSATAEYETQLRDAGSLGGIRLAGSDDPNVRKVYIVQLKAPSATDYHASLSKTAVQPGMKRPRFDKSSPIVKAYASQLLA